MRVEVALHRLAARHHLAADLDHDIRVAQPVRVHGAQVRSVRQLNADDAGQALGLGLGLGHLGKRFDKQSVNHGRLHVLLQSLKVFLKSSDVVDLVASLAKRCMLERESGKKGRRTASFSWKGSIGPLPEEEKLNHLPFSAWRSVLASEKLLLRRAKVSSAYVRTASLTACKPHNVSKIQRQIRFRTAT